MDDQDAPAMSPVLLPFLVFAMVASVTPGPNNIMVAATAAAHGLRATVPQMLGIALGFGFMLVVVGSGVALPLSAHPGWQVALRWVGAAWMLVLAWQIARAPAVAVRRQDGGRPVTGFWGACGLQWVNPKAWVLALATATAYTVPDRDLTGQILLLAAVFVVVGLFTTAIWAGLGAGTGRLLNSPPRMRWFNRIMGVLLATAVVPILFE